MPNESTLEINVHQLSWTRRMLVGGAAGAVGIAAMLGVLDHSGILDLPDVDIKPGGAQPPAAESAVVPGSYRADEEQKFECDGEGTVRMWVDAKAEKMSWHLLEVDLKVAKIKVEGKGVVEKRYPGVLRLCGDKNVLEQTATVERDKVTDKPLSVTAVFPGFVNADAYVDKLSPEFCAALRPGQTVSESRKKVEEYKKAVAKKDKPDCDPDHFQIKPSASFAFEDAPQAKDIAETGAQLAIAVSADPVEIMEKKKPKMLEKMKAHLKTQYPTVSSERIRVIDGSPKTLVEKVKLQVKYVKSKVAERFVIYEFRNNKDGKLELYVEDASGGNATVRYVDSTNVTDRQVAELNKALYAPDEEAAAKSPRTDERKR